MARDINAAVYEDWLAGGPGSNTSLLALACECAHLWCEDSITMRSSEYAVLRREPGRYVVVDHHVDPGAERVIALVDRYYTIVLQQPVSGGGS